MSGTYGWLVMELVAPLAFLVGLSAPISTVTAATASGSGSGWAWVRPSPSTVATAFRALPRARQLLAVAFLVHYANRSLVSTCRNPSRARMHLAVPLSAIVFNAANGFTVGMYVAGGFADSTAAAGHQDGALVPSGGLRPDSWWARPLFWIGMTVWLVGFASNIYHDEVLYSLKRERRGPSPSPNPATARSQVDTPSSSLSSGGGGGGGSRYSIPPRSKGLFRYVSHPSYLSEWLEWTGYLLATFSLGPAPFPSHAATLVSRGGTKRRLVPLPRELQPFALGEGRHPLLLLSPPALFILLEVVLMLPRATRGHRWYERTFGPERWRTEGQRWVLVPYVW